MAALQQTIDLKAPKVWLGRKSHMIFSQCFGQRGENHRLSFFVGDYPPPPTLPLLAMTNRLWVLRPELFKFNFHSRNTLPVSDA